MPTSTLWHCSINQHCYHLCRSHMKLTLCRVFLLLNRQEKVFMSGVIATEERNGGWAYCLIVDCIALLLGFTIPSGNSTLDMIQMLAVVSWPVVYWVNPCLCNCFNKIVMVVINHQLMFLATGVIAKAQVDQENFKSPQSKSPPPLCIASKSHHLINKTKMIGVVVVIHFMVVIIQDI